MTTTEWEKETLDLIHGIENEKIQAERRVEEAKRVIQEKELEIAANYKLLERYRRSHGLPSVPVDHSPSLAAEYAALSPNQMIDRWADKHDGIVIARELTRTVLAAGVYKTYKLASGSVYSTLGRRKDYIKMAPGTFQRKVPLGLR